MKLTPRQAAEAMRVLSESDRNALIEEGGNVRDLRPALNRARRNRALAAMYRQAFSRKPGGNAA